MLYANEYSSDEEKASSRDPSASLPPAAEPADSDNGTRVAGTVERRRKERTPSTDMDNVCSFVQKLYNLVDNPDHSRFVQWNEMGDVFIVFHCEEFAQTVLPRYFKHSKFPSFVRQLNIYGFYRVSDARKTPLVRSKEACVFSHKYFKRNRKDLLPLIRRKVGPKKDAHNNRDERTVARRRHKAIKSAQAKAKAKALKDRSVTDSPAAMEEEEDDAAASSSEDLETEHEQTHPLQFQHMQQRVHHPHPHPHARYLQYAAGHHAFDSYTDEAGWAGMQRAVAMNDYTTLYYGMESPHVPQPLPRRASFPIRRNSETLTHGGVMAPTTTTTTTSSPPTSTKPTSNTTPTTTTTPPTTAPQPRRPPPILTSFDPPKLTHLNLPPLTKSTDVPLARTHQGYLANSNPYDLIISEYDTSTNHTLPTPTSAGPRLTHTHTHRRSPLDDSDATTTTITAPMYSPDLLHSPYNTLSPYLGAWCGAASAVGRRQRYPAGPFSAPCCQCSELQTPFAFPPTRAFRDADPAAAALLAGHSHHHQHHHHSVAAAAAGTSPAGAAWHGEDEY
ncbi:HSF-type DNA-binding-domain-containing protein [Powellomyces hirtus]|nr:HSF-type DNA-binding-domain-containing protein [Powellomyces hirtus]